MLRRLTLALSVAAMTVGVASTAALATGPATGAAGTASAASVSLSGWNLILPVDSSGGTSGNAAVVSPARLYSPWLTQDSSGALNFWAPADGATTPNSLHARTELSGPGTFVLGQGSAGLNETLKVTQLPDSSNQIIIGQMFASSGPFAHLHYQGGKVYGFIHGQTGDYNLLSGVPLGATFSASITASGNTVKFSATYNGQTATQTVTGISSWIGQAMHFQAGDYEQDEPGSASTDGGRVSFSALSQYGVPGGTNPPPANDFSVSASPASGSVKAGSAATTTVTTAATSGSAQSVTLSASGLPTGATAAFSPAMVTSGSSSTLKITTGSSTPAGTYKITVTGTAASGSHSATYTLTVTAPSSGGCSTAWSATASYVPGDKVSYGGDNYTALYWSTDVTPGSAIAWNIWQDDGTC